MRVLIAIVVVWLLAGCAQTPLRGTGDLGLVIERASGRHPVGVFYDRFRPHLRTGTPSVTMSDLGMIDKILDLRHAPISEELLGDPTRSNEAWMVHMAAIDAVLDLLVPAVKAVASLPEDKTNHDGYCVDKRRVTSIIGHPPVSRILPSYRTKRPGYGNSGL